MAWLIGGHPHLWGPVAASGLSGSGEGPGSADGRCGEQPLGVLRADHHGDLADGGGLLRAGQPQTLGQHPGLLGLTFRVLNGGRRGVGGGDRADLDPGSGEARGEFRRQRGVTGAVADVHGRGRTLQ